MLVHEQDLLEGLAAVPAAIDPAHLVRPEEMTHCRDVDQVGVLRMNPDARDVLAVGKAELHPAVAGIGGLPQAIARRDVATDRLFPEADVDHIRVPLGHRDRTYGATEEAIGDVFPACPPVYRLPHASPRCTHVIGFTVLGNARDGSRSTPTIGSDFAPLERLQVGRKAVAVDVRMGASR